MLHRISRFAGITVLALAATAFAAPRSARADEVKAPAWKSQAGKYAVFDTSEGKIVCKLFDKEAPKTVENFVGLATGTKEFKDPVAGSQAKRPYFDGTKFHRIIPGFMMQGGDPTATGTGGPGYTIDDEFAPSLNFNEKGMLAMARTNAPHSAGSQFFITTGATTFLNGKYAIFGKVVEGQEVVDRICSTIGTPEGHPKKDVLLKKLTIENVASK
jgi:peptidyl-prolyl cis-trans isomerase A (cyclophilin A)